jgi:hypothetical protein
LGVRIPPCALSIDLFVTSWTLNPAYPQFKRGASDSPFPLISTAGDPIQLIEDQMVVVSMDSAPNSLLDLRWPISRDLGIYNGGLLQAAPHARVMTMW